jgi:hypothetical protein
MQLPKRTSALKIKTKKRNSTMAQCEEVYLDRRMGANGCGGGGGGGGGG